jgi:hypothetical protein
MKALKSILSVSVLILFAGCATVTDANADLYEEETRVIETERMTGTWDNTASDKMDPIVEKPDMGL